MANFTPLNNYSLYILDKVIKEHNLQPPFLDIACGSGYLSKHLGKKGWPGKAIDSSIKAVSITKFNLKEYQFIKIEKKDFLREKGNYNTVLIFDLLEHLENDISAIKKINSLLSQNGYLVITTPSNPREWRWDDNFYGHIRRYTEFELKGKLTKTGFKVLAFFDYTFPLFWILRRIYTKYKKINKNNFDQKEQTKKSSFVYAWSIPVISNILDKTSFLWHPIYILQYALFKKYVSQGNAIIIVAKKIK